jgi:FkbM family methyltransferase
MKIVDKLRRRLILSQLQSKVEQGGGDLVTLGSEYGGSTVPRSALVAGAVAVCAGAGEDITLDVELNRAGLDVYTLDPTPRAISHVEALVLAAQNGESFKTVTDTPEPYNLNGFELANFHFMPVGIWTSDGPVRFFSPQDEHQVSHSIVNLEQSGSYFEAECIDFESLQKTVGRPIMILKIDIMGAEFDLIKDMMGRKFFVPVLAVELDECQYPSRPGAKRRLFGIIDLLKGSGYSFLHLSRSNALFVRVEDLNRIVRDQSTLNPANSPTG